MNIGVNTLFFIPGQVGGSELYLCETLQAMLPMLGRHRLTLFTNRENDLFLRRLLKSDKAGFVLCPFHASSRPVRILREQIELPVKARRARVDVLWSPGYTMPLLYSGSQVLSVLDMQYKSFPEDLGVLARGVQNLLIQVGVRRADHVLTLSAFSKREIVNYTGADPQQITSVPLGVSVTFGQMGASGRDAHPNRLQPYLLCVANSYPHKNLHTLLEAFALMEEEILHDLVLVGRARRGEPALQAALKKLKNPGRVRRLKGLDTEALQDLYRAADAFVFPSLYEGFGLPVLEALHVGIPTLAFRVASIPEVGGDAVEYAEDPSAEALASAVRKVLHESPEQRARRRARGRKQAALFQWAETARGTLDALLFFRR